MIGANEGEVLSTADALWPLALLYLVSCGALGVGSLALLRHESKRAPAKEEEDDRDLVALEGHEGSKPGEQDWLVVAFFLLVASYLGGLISLETGAAAALTFGLASGLGRAQGLRDAAAASKERGRLRKRKIEPVIRRLVKLSVVPTRKIERRPPVVK